MLQPLSDDPSEELLTFFPLPESSYMERLATPSACSFLMADLRLRALQSTKLQERCNSLSLRLLDQSRERFVVGNTIKYRPNASATRLAFQHECKLNLSWAA